MDTKNKVVIVTGGIGGIGFVTVQHLLRNGVAYVAIFDVVPQDDTSVVNNLEKLGQEFSKEKFRYYICDVTNVEQFTASYKKIVDLKNYVDILVNNAGIAKDILIDKEIAINITAVVHGTMIAIDHMDTRKGYKGGVVLNIGSIASLTNFPFAPLYGATKHAVAAFVRNMRIYNKVFGVRILCLCPDFTETNMTVASESAVRDNSFEFVGDDVIKEALNHYLQKPDNVAIAAVELIQKGDDGDVWFVGNDEPPFAVGVENDVEKLRIYF